ncbi:thioredoxin reductase 1, cytoplasmic-like [Cimex lectularius]|uniref:thioredoxin-disulfide reductase (NADPH) n=1 Tax=Cimex lectularius TaxID=79782 RepID=A0A8I6R9R3_CIMLE|nr:thioredoxin reductase 1, cytoplasmic-like [Cimex lectularius]
MQICREAVRHAVPRLRIGPLRLTQEKMCRCAIRLYTTSGPVRTLVVHLRKFSRSTSMATTAADSASALINKNISENKVFIFSKSWCPFCTKTKELLKEHSISFSHIELDAVDGGDEIQQKLLDMTGQKTVPSIFINGKHIGGFSNLNAIAEVGLLYDTVMGIPYEYDLFVIGGGSGGIAAVKEARKYSKKVALCDFVHPSPRGSKWGIGGTCVNVGCIPKKLMHRASLIHHDLADAASFGWPTSKEPHNWNTLVENIGNYIKSLNFNYRKELRKNEIPVMNGYAEFVDNHTVQVTDASGNTKNVTSRMFIIASGLRPFYPNISGAKEYCITSDDLFSLKNNPGETLIVGASYIALECAGFLAGLGIPCTVMVRSILLRGFDQEIAEKIGKSMKDLGIKFVRPCIPTNVTKEGEKLKVEGTYDDGKPFAELYDTVMFATGREAQTDSLGLKNAGIFVNPKSKKIFVNNKEQTTAPNIFAIGDVADVGLELTPVAIKAGRLLAKRLFGISTALMDYTNVPTTVFTPLEYGCVGYSEESAREKYTDVEVFHNIFKPLESVLSERFDSLCFAKLVCKKEDKKWKVIGLHVLGPNAGEITQGFALALKMGASKDDFDSLVGIHPTNAEVFTTMTITKSSGEVLDTGGC